MTDYESESETSTVNIEYEDNINDDDITVTDSEISSEIEMLEYDIESDDEEYDELYQEDSMHIYSEKIDNNYYIGLAKYNLVNKIIMMVNSVSSRVFFRHPYKLISEYLAKYSIIRTKNAKVHIMKLCVLPDETYSVILKTYWIKLIQRHWKKAYRERKRIIKARMIFNNRRINEITGKYPYGLNRIPSIYGLLSNYK